MSKYIDLIAWDDVPHLRPPFVTEEELAEFEASLLPHQRRARRTGRPELGAGAIYPVDEREVLVKPFKIPEYFERGYALDVGWSRTAATFGARDPDTDVIYVTHEYYEAEKKPAEHSRTLDVVADGWMKCAIDPASRGSSQYDGRKLFQAYSDLGLNVVMANNAVEAGLHHCLLRMQEGRLRVFSNCRNWLREFRLYRRDEKGRIVKVNDHLMDCTRYLCNTPGIFRTKPAERSARRPSYSDFGGQRG